MEKCKKGDIYSKVVFIYIYRILSIYNKFDFPSSCHVIHPQKNIYCIIPDSDFFGSTCAKAERIAQVRVCKPALASLKSAAASRMISRHFSSSRDWANETHERFLGRFKMFPEDTDGDGI